MSYHVECQVCRHQVEVSDPSARTDQCPECGSFFTMMPAVARPPAAAPSPPPEPPAAAPAPPAPVPRALRPVEAIAAAVGRAPSPERPARARTRAEEHHTPLAPEPVVPTIQAILVTTEPQPDDPTPDPEWVDTKPAPPEDGSGQASGARTRTRRTRQRARRSAPAAAAVQTANAPEMSGLLDPGGPGALIVGLAALACVWVPRLSGLVVPLGLFGLLWGVIAMAVAGSVRRPRFWPATGTAVSVATLLIVLAPSVGSLFTSRADPTLPPVTVIPDREWVDADRADGQRLGDVSVQVVSVTLGTADPPPAAARRSTANDKKTVAADKKLAGPEKVLIVRLRARRDGGGAESGGLWRERPKAALTDDAGRELAPRPAAAARLAPKPAAASADEVVVFVAPVRIRKFLRLEVPAAALGQGGAYRFLIPPDMIQPDPAAAGSKGV